MITTRMAVAIWLTAAAAQGRQTGQNITISLQFGVADRLRLAPLARELATRMLNDAGIAVNWKPEHGAAVSGLLVVIQIVGARSPDFMPGTLAYTDFERGGHVTLFLDRIETMENPAVVFAHVLVHEITHVLQGIPRHSEAGVMKARWTGRDYSEMRLHPLRFLPEDVELIRQGLSN